MAADMYRDEVGADDERALFAAYRADPSPGLRREIADRFVWIVPSVAAKWCAANGLHGRDGAEAWYGPGTEGLLRAVDGFRADAGARFQTYAWQAVWFALDRESFRLHGGKRSARKARCLRTRQITGAVEFAHLSAPPPADRPELPDFDELVRPVEARRREALRLRFREGLDHKGIGERLGVSRSRAGQFLTEAIGTLREYPRLAALACELD